MTFDLFLCKAPHSEETVDCSVVVATYNRSQLLGDALRTLCAIETATSVPKTGLESTQVLGNEEFEFAHRPFLKDKRIAYEPSVVVPHRIGANRLCKAFFLRRHFDHA